MSNNSKVHLRGFASMDPEKAAEIQKQGGKACQAKGTGHKYTPAEAKAASDKSVAARKAKAKSAK